MIDLNNHLIEFSKSVAQKNGYKPDDRLVLDKLIFHWQNTAFKELNGLSPRAYVEKMSPEELVSALEFGENTLITARIERTPECAPHLFKLLITTKNEETIASILPLLAGFDCPEPLETYIKLIKKDLDGGLKEKIIDRLKINADAARPLLLDGIEDADLAFKTIAGEILLEGERNENTFKLLVELFLSGENIPLYAGYLGKYGDERAAAYLYPALDKADYVDFLEIKNAIERLGGLVDDDLRDFSDDPLFHLIKNAKPE